MLRCYTNKKHLHGFYIQRVKIYKNQKNMNTLNCSIISLGWDLTDLQETTIFKINLEKLHVRFEVFSLDHLHEKR